MEVKEVRVAGVRGMTSVNCPERQSRRRRLNLMNKEN